MGLRRHKPAVGSRINWTNPEDEVVHENVLVLENSPKVVVRSMHGYPREVNLKDIDRKPDTPEAQMKHA